MTVEVKAFSKLLAEDKAYRDNLLKRLRSGKAGAMEPIVWYYAYGKPREAIDMSVRELPAVRLITHQPLSPEPSEASHGR